MLCRITWHGATLVIEEPARSRKEILAVPLLLFLLIAVPLLAFGAYSHFFLPRMPVVAAPLLASSVVAAMLFVVFVAAVLASLPQLGRRRVIEADRDSLRFRTQGRFASQSTKIRASDITELRIAFGHLAIITPRDCRVVCGRLDNPISKAELEWLRNQLVRALTGAPEREKSLS
jgi:hypothetical protein